MNNKKLLLGAIRFGELPNDAGIIVGYTRDDITMLFEDPEIMFTVQMEKLRAREALGDGDTLWLW